MKNQSSKPNGPIGGASLKLITRAVLGALFCGLLTQSAPAAAPSSPAGSDCEDMTLAQWQECWNLWCYGLLDVPTDSLGNAVIGNTILMPAPTTDPSAAYNVTIRPDEAFVLGLWGYMGTSYKDGTPDDPPIPMSVFRTLNITFTIDNRIVVNKHNVLDYYSEFDFDPPFPVPTEWGTPMKAFIWSQGITILHPSLPPGDHVLTLNVENRKPFFDGYREKWIFGYNCTWNLHVTNE